jgi:hypothetical protein
MSQYFVTGNLRHDGRRFKRGDAIELTDAQAKQLAHVIQAEAMAEAEAPAEAATPVSPVVEVAVGGEPMQTGEPSIDGTSNATRSDAKDVTPPVAQANAPVEEKKPEAPARRAWFGRGTSAEPAKEPAQEPAAASTPPVDPSADL